ncbi:MAG: methyltransferase family protein, partial [Candidatus Thorarchaeota archaeon]
RLFLLFTPICLIIIFSLAFYLTYRRLGKVPPHKHDFKTFSLASLSIIWVLIASIIALYPALSRFIIILEFMLNPLVVFFGILFSIISIILMFLGFLSMGDSFRMGIPDIEGQSVKLVTSGIFRYTRNPGFLGLDCAVCGTFLLAPSIVTLILMISTWIIFHFQILDEEKFLLKVHGEKYINYKRSAGRYFPKIRS